ncbi:ras-related and estrogen-regulated growth inhibitor [Chrysoperla carnea]|uniref:ras-related and estrogen-regulated growth inhibitor n=1 Tax=Chrysoperla carnea TaxID=189513 RepID=UPI001D0671D3|nr:ras-related and estrogen-regulated growth inhibitor [Chrysoperla carnea]
MNATSPKSPLCKLGLYPRPKTLKVMVLGQAGVGKSAMVVRFITKRYIGEYDPNLERIYTFHTVMDNEMVYFDVLDTAGQPHETECLALETNIRWAEAFILMYSVTDKCSFDECNRLKFLINYNKKRRRLGSNTFKETLDVPVVLVGNKIDQWGERMVSSEEGQRRSKEIGCVCFHEISVRESIEQVWNVFRDVCRFWRVHNKCPSKLRRSSSDVRTPTSELPSPANENTKFFTSSKDLTLNLGTRWTNLDEDNDESSTNPKTSRPGSKDSSSTGLDSGTSSPRTDLDLHDTPFRGRASTDGHLHSRPWKWRYPPTSKPSPSTSMLSELQTVYPAHQQRRMSISMRGNNASY